MSAILDGDRPWRLIPPMTAPGRLQMQIDAWLLRQLEQRHQPPTLRFYQWSRPAVSLGYFQRDLPEHWATLLQETSLDLVRRPTGGRAVLHGGDLTYAVAARYRQGSRTQIYRHLCEFLIRGWQCLGLQLHYGDAGRSYRERSNCFGTATRADLVDPQGHKFIGSAQRYGRNSQKTTPMGYRVVLQHGSMQLAPNAQLFTQLFGDRVPAAPFPSHQVDDAFIDQVVNALTAAARNWFGVDFIVQPLSPRELADAQALALSV